MKTNETVSDLCAFLSSCRPDYDDIAASCKGANGGRMEEFVAKYRSVCIDAACNPPGVEGVEYFQPKSEEFSFERKGVGNLIIKNKGAVLPYVMMSDFVTADGLVTLVEMRLLNRGHIPRYFESSIRKHEVLRDLAGDKYGWILMLPLEHLGSTSSDLDKFKREGGHVAIMPHTAAEMKEKVYLHASLEHSTIVL